MNATMNEGMVSKLVSKNGGQEVWVVDVVEALNAEGIETDLVEFKAWALAAHVAGTVTLRRHDLVHPSWMEKLNASEIKGMARSTFHTIR